MDKRDKFPFKRTNYYLLIGGFLLVLIGFMLMAGGGSDDPTKFTGDELFSFRRITLAPIVVLLGFVVVAVGILLKPKSE